MSSINFIIDHSKQSYKVGGNCRLKVVPFPAALAADTAAIGFGEENPESPREDVVSTATNLAVIELTVLLSPAIEWYVKKIIQVLQ